MEKFEALTLASFVDVVTKLNDAAFKPLFRRLFDWAFNDVTGSGTFVPDFLILTLQFP